MYTWEIWWHGKTHTVWLLPCCMGFVIQYGFCHAIASLTLGERWKRQSGAEHWSLQYFEDVAGCWTCVWVLGVLLSKFYLQIIEAKKQCRDAAMSLRKLCPQAFEGVGCTFLHIQCCLLHILQGWQVEKVLVVWMQILNEKTAAPSKYTWPSGLCNALMPHSGFWKVKVFQRK